MQSNEILYEYILLYYMNSWIPKQNNTIIEQTNFIISSLLFVSLKKSSITSTSGWLAKLCNCDAYIIADTKIYYIVGFKKNNRYILLDLKKIIYVYIYTQLLHFVLHWYQYPFDSVLKNILLLQKNCMQKN